MNKGLFTCKQGYEAPNTSFEISLVLIQWVLFVRQGVRNSTVHLSVVWPVVQVFDNLKYSDKSECVIYCFYFSWLLLFVFHPTLGQGCSSVV